MISGRTGYEGPPCGPSGRRLPRAGLLLLVGAGLAGCSQLTESDGGVVAVEITTPSPAEVVIGDTVRLTARALDSRGDPIAATIGWATPDTTISVDGDGLVTGLTAGPGRVQASSGAFVSALVTVTVTEPSP